MMFKLLSKRKKKPQENNSKTNIEKALVLPRGITVKVDGIPCELLQDTSIYSEHYWQARQQDNAEG